MNTNKKKSKKNNKEFLKRLSKHFCKTSTCTRIILYGHVNRLKFLTFTHIVVHCQLATSLRQYIKHIEVLNFEAMSRQKTMRQHFYVRSL